jgi:prepilin-type N-terminal cleavage/methylation domain-containing protein
MRSFKNIKHIYTNNQGFTLLEVIIAITLLSLLMISVYSITNNSTTTIERVLKEDSELGQVETAMSRMNLDFSHIYSPLYFEMSKSQQKKFQDKKPRNDQQAFIDPTLSKNFPQRSANGHRIPAIFNDNKSTIAFFSSVNRKKIPNSKESNFAWIRYSLQSYERDEYLDSEIKQGSYQIVRQMAPTDPYAPETYWNDVKPQVLMKSVDSLLFEFWNEKSQRFVDSIKQLDNQFLIRAVKITIKRFDSNGTEELITRVYRPLWPYFNTMNDLKETKQ